MGKKLARVKITFEKLEVLHEMVLKLPQKFVPDGDHQMLLLDHLEEMEYEYSIMIAKKNTRYTLSFTAARARAFFIYFREIGDAIGVPNYHANLLNSIIEVLDKTFGLVQVKRLR